MPADARTCGREADDRRERLFAEHRLAHPGLDELAVGRERGCDDDAILARGATVRRDRATTQQMNGIVSAILFGIVASTPNPEAISGAERREDDSAKRTDPVGENADAPPPRPVVIVASSDMIRATIDADARLRKRWRRGSALLGVGVVTTIGAATMLLMSGLAAQSNDWCGTSSWTQNGHTVTMDDPCPNRGIGRTSIGLIAGSVALAAAGAAMMGFGIRDRVIAKREARRRLSIAAAPTRNGATFAFTLRF